MQGNSLVKDVAGSYSQISIKQYLLIKEIPAPSDKLIHSHPAISLINCLICKQRDQMPKPPPSSIFS